MTKLSKYVHPLFAIPAITVAVSVAVAASSHAQSTPLPMACAVELRDMGRSVEITARLIAFDAIQGSYALSINHASSGGSAVINQGGPFTLAPGDDTILGQTFLAGEPREIDVDFTLDWNGLALRCPTETN